MSDAEEIFATLFHAHFGGLVRLATLIGADDPEDVVQEAFSRLHSRRRTLREPDRALPYLRACVVNLSRSRVRHLGVARRHAAVTRPDGVTSSPAAMPETATLLREDQQRLLAAVERLSARQREVIVLRYWCDLGIPETARAMRITVGAVKSHTGRALANLRGAMKEGDA